MLKSVSRQIDDILFGQGIIGFLSLIYDRTIFCIFYKHYYRKKFKNYGNDIRWGRDFKRLVIPNSIRISCPEKISIGDHARIDDYVFLQCDQTQDSGISIGKNARINTHTHILSGSVIRIDEEVLVAPFCLISSNNHRFDLIDSIMNQGMKCSGEIIIGRGSWIGQNAKILGGSNIGKNAVVGTGAIVLRGSYGDHAKILGQSTVNRQ